MLDEIIEHLDYAHRYSDYIATTCIFHDDNRPSLIIREDYYQCLACGARGRTAKLLEKLSGRILAPRQDIFRNPFTTWLRHDSLGGVLKLAWNNLRRSPSSYLRRRGIPDKIQIKLGIGMLDDWITFPIRREDGKIVGAVARAGESNPATSKYVVPSGQNQNLLYVPSWERVNDSKKVYCVFGILDAVTLYVCGVASISTTSGKRLSDVSSMEKIRKTITFIPDYGEEINAMQIAARLGWRGQVAKVLYPDGTKDVNDIYVKYPTMLQELLQV